MSSTTPNPAEMNRRQQLMATWRMAKKTDPAITWITLATFVVGAVVGFGLLWMMPGNGILKAVLGVITALLFGVLLALIVFGRRAQKAMYVQMEDQVGAGASALTMLRRGWQVKPMVGFNRQQDLVHRVVGPPGIVLVGEGESSSRVRQLLASEKRKHERVVVDVPVHEVVVGSGEGEVPIAKLVKHVQKLDKAIKPAEMTDVLNRLKAIDAQRGTMPIPKGPMPTSMKGQRGNLRGR